MPKENVRDLTSNGFRAEIGWTAGVPDDRDGYVQIATTNQHSKLRLPPDDETPWRLVARLERELVDAREFAASATEAAPDAPSGLGTSTSKATVAKPMQQFEGWHVTLDRDGINRMIRVLRRARDAAYGSDA